MLNLASANRDPDVFPEADVYHPYRSLAGKHLAFGVGPHACVGATLIRSAALAALRVFSADPGLTIVSESAEQTPTLRYMKSLTIDFSDRVRLRG